MKFFMAKQAEITNKLEFMETKIVIAKDQEEAMEKYKSLLGIAEEETSFKIICKEVKEGSISFTVPIDKFVVQYPENVKTVTVRCLSEDMVISGYLIAEIPAKASLKEEEILEYMYRGNIERYNETLLAARNDEKIRLSLRRLRQAIPYHRLVIDTGTKNVIVPINSNYVIED